MRSVHKFHITGCESVYSTYDPACMYMNVNYYVLLLYPYRKKDTDDKTKKEKKVKQKPQKAKVQDEEGWTQVKTPRVRTTSTGST